jgi:hypothetical protein
MRRISIFTMRRILKVGVQKLERRPPRPTNQHIPGPGCTRSRRSQASNRPSRASRSAHSSKRLILASLAVLLAMASRRVEGDSHPLVLEQSSTTRSP